MFLKYVIYAQRICSAIVHLFVKYNVNMFSGDAELVELHIDFIRYLRS